MSLAADLSSGTEQYVYDRGDCETKDLISGFAARNGVFAVRLASNGFLAPRAGWTGSTVSSGPSVAAPTSRRSLIRWGRISSSPRRPSSPTVVVAIHIRLWMRFSRSSGSIRWILQRSSGWWCGPISMPSSPRSGSIQTPGSREVAGLSIRVAAAVALVRGSAWPDDYEYWDDPQVRRLRQLVEIEVEPEIEATYPDRNGARVVLELRDGRTLEGFVEYAGGEPENPMSEEQLKAKFEALNGHLLPAGRCDEIFSTCMKLERLDSVARLLELDDGRGRVSRGRTDESSERTGYVQGATLEGVASS